MLVAKYKRVGSDDEGDGNDGQQTNKSLANSGNAVKSKEEAESKSTSILPHKTLSVAPAIPEYKLGVCSILIFVKTIAWNIVKVQKDDWESGAKKPNLLPPFWALNHPISISSPYYLLTNHCIDCFFQHFHSQIIQLQDVSGSSNSSREVGPQHPNKARKGERNVFGGRVDDDGTDAYMFEMQRRSFETSGVSFDPTGQYVVQKRVSGYGRSDKKRAREGGVEEEEVEEKQVSEEVDWRQKGEKTKKGEERDPRKDPSNVASFLGSWGELGKRKKAPTREEEEEARKKKEEELAKNGGAVDANVASEGVVPTYGVGAGPSSRKKQKLDEESEWHGKEEEKKRTTEGLSWIHSPRAAELAANSKIEIKDAQIDRDLMKLLMANNADGEMSDSRSAKSAASAGALGITQKFSAGAQNFIPKKVVHTWAEATKGLTAARFVPRHGHLLLSASMDGNLRIYETGFFDHGKKRRCLMTYKGHDSSIRELDWNPDGTRFLSASYDKCVRLWDAETGKTIGKFMDGKSSVPYCCKFYPMDGSQIFLVGQSNRKIVQWDTRSNEIVQEYNRHLGAVNSITFIDQNRRFVTSSDDKSIRVWDFDVPVDIKYIADPKMHSMPCITLHPNGKSFLAQGLDNKIHVYSTRDKFPANHKKKFTGHLVSGYACNISVSPDGRCVTSGDSSGQIFFWDWKTCKILKRIKAHTDTAIDVQWHPLNPSTVVSAGWDAQLKLWD
jgi:WD40 repeat protein